MSQDGKTPNSEGTPNGGTAPNNDNAPNNGTTDTNATSNKPNTEQTQKIAAKLFDDLSHNDATNLSAANLLRIVRGKLKINADAPEADVRRKLKEQLDENHHAQAKNKWKTLNERLNQLDLARIEESKNKSDNKKSDNKKDKAKRSDDKAKDVAPGKKATDNTQKDAAAAAAEKQAKSFVDALKPEDGNAHFLVHETLRKKVLELTGKKLEDTIEFFGPDRNEKHRKLDREILGEEDRKLMVTAVRLNENYLDNEAAHKGERSYVRRAAAKARHIVIYQCRNKNAVMIMWGFEAKNINVSGKTTSVVAAERTHWISAAAVLGGKTPIKVTIKRDRFACRVYASRRAIEQMNEWAGTDHSPSIKNAPEYMGGYEYKCITMFLNEEEIKKAQGHGALVEKMEHIVSSEAKKRQFTLRRAGSQFTDTFLKATQVQKMFPGSLCRVTGPDSIRFTLASAFDSSTNAKLRAKHPGWMVYEDVPLNVFMHARMKDQEGTQELPKGRVKAKIITAGTAHIEEVKAITKHFNGEEMHAMASKFTDLPTTYVIHLPAGFDFRKVEGVPIALDGALATYFIEQVDTPTQA